MRQVSVDAKSRIATIAGGALARDVASAAGAHGLVAALGGCGAVGMAGLTLGGGYGPLNGLYGLAADNLLAAELVLADGHIVNASPREEPELFWAIRGGGGNFGVVTSLRVRLHEVQRMLAGPIIYPLSEATSVLQRYSEIAATAPDELGLPVSLNSGPDGSPLLLILPLWNGDKDRGERIIHCLRSLGTPQLAQVGPTTYSDMLRIFDTTVDALADCHWAARTRSLPSPLSIGAIDIIVRAAANRTSPYSMVNWHYFHGASTRIAPDATAFGLRQEHFMVEIFAGWMPGSDDGTTHRRWAQELWEDLAPYALQPSYAAFLETSERKQAIHAYGKNGEKLRSLKKRFDPLQLFASAIPLPL
jgi:FAD/FMN-containing dehydrogenase